MWLQPRSGHALLGVWRSQGHVVLLPEAGRQVKDRILDAILAGQVVLCLGMALLTWGPSLPVSIPHGSPAVVQTAPDHTNHNVGRCDCPFVPDVLLDASQITDRR